jgi:periplasmic copper chaperone A
MPDQLNRLPFNRTGQGRIWVSRRRFTTGFSARLARKAQIPSPAAACHVEIHVYLPQKSFKFQKGDPMSRRKELLAVLSASLVLGLAVLASLRHAQASEGREAMATSGTLTASKAWARISPVSGNPSAAFVTITNRGTADALVAAEAPLAGRIELHQHLMTGTVMRMRKTKAIPVAAKTTTVLGLHSYHLMLFDLKSQPLPGTVIPLTLRFKSGKSLTLDMIAQGISAMGPDGDSPMTQDHMGH